MRCLFSLTAAALLLALAGCGGGLERSVVTGKVTYKGKPLTKGQIRFIIDNQPSAMGQIENGTYRIDHLGGVPVGKGKVEIDGFEETGKVIFTGPSGEKAVEARQVLPAKYNTKTELTVEITKGENEKNFDLQP
jgi:hypothetical protein